MRVSAEGLRYDPVELGFHLVHGVAGSQTGTVADAEDVRVDRKCFFAKGCVEDNIRGFPSDARKGLEVVARARDLAAVLLS